MQISKDRESTEPNLPLLGSKCPRVLGLINKMIDQEKLKQTTLSKGKEKKLKELACYDGAKQAYALRISFHKFSLPNVDLMCEANAKYGSSYKRIIQSSKV